MSQVPDYWIEPSKLELMRVLNGTFLALSCFTVALRIWTRTRIVRCWGWDDKFMCLTLAVFIGECTVWLRLADVEGRPVSLANLETYAALICAEQALYIAGTICLKISLAFFFLRFLITRWSRHIVWISVILYTIIAVAMLFLVVFECGIPRNYVIKQTSGKCVSFRVQSCVGYVHGALNALTDWVFPLLAIQFLVRTKLSRMAKVSCCAILLLAVVGSVASIVRTVYIPRFGPGGNIYAKNIDPLIWTLIEGALGIIAASLATLRPLFQRCSTKTREVLQSKSTGDRSSSSKLAKSSLSSTLNCFGSTRPALVASPLESEAEKCDTIMEVPKTTTRPLHLGILSSVATETQLHTQVMDKTRTMV
ncbi:hypothetical protein QM012_007754 [Aureobasidium pullulans]|uniref:Rhodopsin domain-containing protein n=1 Tax=Aureobasidium pullulans TaxID=5580 RepID=A0ABR0TM37_AURPU